MLPPLQPAAFLALFAASRFMHFVSHLGLLGLFLVSIVDSSFVPLPVPGVTDVMIVLFAAHHSNVILLVLVATIGSALGGLFSHMVGQAGGMVFLEKHVPARILGPVTRWMQSHALLAVALPAILPPPAPLSPFVLAAGALNMGRKRFMIAFTVSRFVRHVIAAWLGVHYGHGVLHLWKDLTARWGDAFLIVLWSVILLFASYAFFKLYRTSRRVGIGASRRRAAGPATDPQP
ncbi:MAG TPA: membrane-associated protein [Acidobacteriaceae bacterium]|nr:membrane-associated protein [Acidobacteriaceae bacterium]